MKNIKQQIEMKKEILFRGKDSRTNKWVYGWFVPIIGEADSILVKDVRRNVSKNMTPFTYSYSQVKASTIGQYIGVKDSCEDHIFEGDILLIYGGVGVIIWDTHSMRWGLESPGSCAVDFPMREDYERSKVIGNIYDNENIIK